MGKRDDKKRLRAYGRAVCDFANAKTIDEACFRHFTNVQRILGFSPDFAEQARRAFPTLDLPDVFLLISDLDLLALYDRQRRIMLDLRDLLKDTGYEIEEYDGERKKLWVAPFYIEPGDFKSGDSPTRSHYGYECMTLTGLALAVKDKLGPGLLERVLGKIDSLMTLQKEISAAESSLPKSHIKELEILCTKHPRLVTMQGSLLEYHKYLREVLNSITGGVSFDGIPVLSTFLKAYNPSPRARLVPSEQGLAEAPWIDEKDYLAINSPDKWKTRIKHDLAFFLVEFLKFPPNRECVIKCHECGNYAIHERRRSARSDHRFCSDKCRMAYHNNRKRESARTKRA
ncbi:MAG: hypothetical protein SWQ30_02785 [Thermodesulfobacteriota bacterium]|nr:hypothetical protein [Thermodesulfobacteriota bacterium]